MTILENIANLVRGVRPAPVPPRPTRLEVAVELARVESDGEARGRQLREACDRCNARIAEIDASRQAAVLELNAAQRLWSEFSDKVDRTREELLRALQAYEVPAVGEFLEDAARRIDELSERRTEVWGETVDRKPRILRDNHAAVEGAVRTVQDLVAEAKALRLAPISDAEILARVEAIRARLPAAHSVRLRAPFESQG